MLSPGSKPASSQEPPSAKCKIGHYKHEEVVCIISETRLDCTRHIACSHMLGCCEVRWK